jgi:AcrR family transcriptional regulator
MMYHTVHFCAMAGKDPKGRLLEAAIAHIASRGVSDLSLRELAAAIGTSHRMLIHHFGGREGLWVEVIRTVEERQRAAFAAVEPAPDATAGDVQRLSVHRGAEALLDGIVDAWLPFATVALEALGMAHEEALAHARLGVAVTRGLLLDLLATGNREAVDAAMEAYIDLMERKLGSVLPNPD